MRRWIAGEGTPTMAHHVAHESRTARRGREGAPAEGLLEGVRARSPDAATGSFEVKMVTSSDGG